MRLIIQNLKAWQTAKRHEVRFDGRLLSDVPNLLVVLNQQPVSDIYATPMSGDVLDWSDLWRKGLFFFYPNWHESSLLFSTIQTGTWPSVFIQPWQGRERSRIFRTVIVKARIDRCSWSPTADCSQMIQIFGLQTDVLDLQQLTVLDWSKSLVLQHHKDCLVCNKQQRDTQAGWLCS